MFYRLLFTSFVAIAPAVPASAASRLVEAVQARDSVLARSLLERGQAKVDERDDASGLTPLMWASNLGDVRMVQLLIQRGADANAADTAGQTPLFLTMSKPMIPAQPKRLDDMVAIMRLLIAHHANLEAHLRGVAGMPEGITPLRYAAVTEVELVRVLLEGGADANAMDSRGTTPLMAAVDARWGAVTDADAKAKVTLLLQHGAVVDAAAASLTPLMVALWNDLGETATLLAEHGARLDATSDNGTTMLMFAAHAALPELLAKILEAGADVRAQNKSGDTALCFALVERTSDDARERSRDVVRALLAAGADKNGKNKRGQTPLMMAAKSGDAELFGLFGKQDFEAVDADGATVLMHAAAGGNATIVRALVSRGLDAEATDKDGDTALHWAAARGRREVVQALLDAGVPIDATNGRGVTPVRLAASCDDAALIDTAAALTLGGADTSGLLTRARRCEGPALERALTFALGERQRRKEPEAEQEAVVLGSFATAEEAASWREGITSLLPNVSDILQLLPELPAVMTRETVPELGTGHHVVLGFCDAPDADAPLRILKALAPSARLVHTAHAPTHYSCPLVPFRTLPRTMAQLQDDGRLLTVASFVAQRPTRSPMTHFASVLWAKDGRLLGEQHFDDYRYPEQCPQASYEEIVAREPKALRLILGCLVPGRAGRPPARVNDIYRFEMRPTTLGFVEIEKWAPPAAASPPIVVRPRP